MKVFYHIDLNHEQAEQLKAYLRDNNIYFEPSQNYNLVHLEIKADENEANKINKYLENN